MTIQFSANVSIVEKRISHAIYFALRSGPRAENIYVLILLLHVMASQHPPI
ncbi:hypothetical protein ACJ5NV_12905 [Loktanella agnita]